MHKDTFTLILWARERRSKKKQQTIVLKKRLEKKRAHELRDLVNHVIPCSFNFCFSFSYTLFLRRLLLTCLLPLCSLSILPSHHCTVESETMIFFFVQFNNVKEKRKIGKGLHDIYTAPNEAIGNLERYVSSTNEWARKETKGLLKLITEFTLCSAQSIMKKTW